MRSDRIILDLCAGSGAWSAPYVEAGYEVRRYDILTGSDVRLLEVFEDRPYGILCAPPCTNFSLAKTNFHGVTREDLLEGLSVVDACLRVVQVARPYFWALENPVGTLSRYIGPPRLIFNPCDYGDGWTKRTALWGKFKPPRRAPVPVTEPYRIKNLYDYNPERKAARRAVTPPGFAKAFFLANQ